MFFPCFLGKHDQQNELQQSLQSCYYYLAENMDLIELIPWLQSYDVLEVHEVDFIKTCRTSFKQNCCLLDLMMMKSNQQILTFIQGLKECNQYHLAEKLNPAGKGQ